ncbi:HU family DNA-binding protein [Parabacteroides bouchesdurhonensis]|uniref:HU family DNA-binding protein n=1 Tax=Parabacteroides bouchesdurhonensis TaxID=1936995 RepID=UPI000C8278D6|nr:HU family DNA-binding protein [Parabacteroides bouchesdurhonensis]
MNKTDLSNELAKRLSVSRCQARHFIDAFREVLGDCLLQDDSILIQDFGRFDLWIQNERNGRNPKTGTPAIIRARNSIKFKPSPRLLKKLNRKE